MISLLQAVSVPTSDVVASSNVFVQIITAISPLALGIIAILAKQTGASKALKVSKRETEEEFNNVKDEIKKLGEGALRVTALASQLDEFTTDIIEIKKHSTDDYWKSRLVDHCGALHGPLKESVDNVAQQVLAIAEKLNVVQIHDNNHVEALIFKKSFYSKLAHLPNMFPTNRGLLMLVNKFFSDHLELIDTVITDLEAYPDRDVLLARFDSLYSDFLSNVGTQFGTAFVEILKREHAEFYEKSEADVLSVVDDEFNSKRARLYAVELSFIEMSQTIFLKVYQEYLRKYSKEPGDVCQQ